MPDAAESVTGGHRERRLTLYAGRGYQRVPRTEAYEAGIAAYISKPLDAELVKSKVAKILGA